MRRITRGDAIAVAVDVVKLPPVGMAGDCDDDTITLNLYPWLPANRKGSNMPTMFATQLYAHVNTLAVIYDEVLVENVHMVDNYGIQSYRDGTGWYRDTHEAYRAQQARDHALEDQRLTWRHILEAKVAEAFAETDPAKLRAELIQVVAVAGAWVDCIDRREAGFAAALRDAEALDAAQRPTRRPSIDIAENREPC